MENSEKRAEADSAGSRTDTHVRVAPRSPKKIISIYAISFLLLATVVAGFIWHDLRADYLDTLAYWNVQLSSSADERVRVNTLWLKERRIDTIAVAEDPGTIRLLSAGGSGSQRAETRQEVEREIADMAVVNGFLGGAVADRDCQIKAQTDLRTEMAESVEEACRAGKQTGEYRVGTFGKGPGHVWVIQAAPVLAEGRASPSAQGTRRVVGSAVMVTEPGQDTVRVFGAESVGTRVVETLIVWKMASEAFIFSPRLSARGVESSFRRPLTGSTFESRVARDGDVAFGEFLDYRGHRVFSVARRIGVPGHSVACIVDRDEALSGHRRRAVLEELLGVLSVLLFGFLMVALHRDAAARDLEERLRQQKELREREHRYRVLFESAGDGIFLMRGEHFVDCNQKALELFRCGREHLIGSTPYAFSPRQQPNGRDSQEAALERIRLALEGQTLHFEWQQRRWDGAPFEAEVTLSRLEIAGEAHLLALVRDVTEQKRAEEALRRRAAFDELMTRILGRFATCAWSEVDASVVNALQAVAEFIGVDHAYVIMFSPDRTTWSATHEWCGPKVPPRLPEFQNIKLGTQPWSARRLLADEIIRVNSWDDLPPEAWAERQHYEVEGALSALDVPIKVAAGVTRGCVGFHSNARPLAWSDTDVAHVRMLGDAIANVIERKRTEEALRDSQQRYRHFISHSNEGVWRMELEQPIPIGLPEEESLQRLMQYAYIAECNLAQARNMGFSTPEEVVGKRLRELFSPLDRERMESIRSAARDGWQSRTVELRGLDPAGNPRHFLRTEIPIVENGLLVRGWGITRDITALKRAEEERQRSFEQLRALAGRLQSIREEERKRVAREIHDQLGQALTAIKIDLGSLMRELPAEKERPSKRAESIFQLVDETIRSVRRISTELRPGILDDLGLVATIEWAGEEFEARTGTTVRLDLPQDDIAVDPERATAIFRIFQETLTNVARHAEASAVEVRLAKEDGDLKLEVHDNGKGVCEDKLSNGRSLGILGMRERAMLLGGELSISGPPGIGTTVRVRIPAARQNQAE